MRKIVLSLAILLVAQVCLAGPTTVQVLDKDTRPHTLEILSGDLGGAGAGTVWRGFCLEWQEPVWNNGVFDATLGSNAMNGGNVWVNDIYGGDLAPAGAAGDPLDAMSAWIVTNWQGNYDGLDAQWAIWYIEAEWDQLTAGAQPIFDAAYDAVYNKQWENNSVSVVTLTLDGENIQDHTIVVPAPGAVLLTGLGTCMIGLVRRRFMV